MPSAKDMSLRSGRMSGVAITSLPRWYFWIVSAWRLSRSSTTCDMPSAAARPPALRPPGPEPMMTT
jgi:hypothetical protein